MAERQLDLFAGLADVAEKPCGKCGAVKPLEAFWVAKNRADGRQAWCIDCGKAYRGSPRHQECARRRQDRIRAIPLDSAEKPCKKCGTCKPLTQFYAAGDRKDGRQAWCIDCSKARSRSDAERARRNAHKRTDEYRAKRREYNKSEKGKAAQERYAAGGKKAIARKAWIKSEAGKRFLKGEKYRAAIRRYANSEKGKENQRRQRRSPARKAFEKSPKVKEARRRMKQQPHHKEWLRRHREKNRESLRAYFNRKSAERRSRKRGLPTTFTVAEWRAAMDFFGHRCAYCGSVTKLVREHFIPMIRGGPYTRANIVPACGSCNSAKCDHPPEVWCPPDVYARVKAYLDSFT